MHQNEIKVTYGDVIDIEGEPHPRETQLTETECFMLKERLDYIFWLNRGHIDRNGPEDWHSNIEVYGPTEVETKL